MSNTNATIGNYQIIKEIARGTSGIVYLARHIHLTHRIVAIKFLHMAFFSSEQERSKFLQEASFLDLLKHPYILPIFDVSTHEGYPYIVAEYASNGSLKERIRAHAPGLLPEQEAQKMLSQVGQALHYAHQRNIVHRDLKPANVLFNANGDALLADFSIALKLDATHTQLTDASGTPYYMAPEQFEGIVSKKSDQYALGCIAYELVTGQRPFTALDWRALAFKHARETPVAPSQFNPQLPAYVEQAILKAMSKDRADRFEDVAAFLAALRLSPTSQAGIPTVSQTNIPTVLSLQPRQPTLSPSPLENTPHAQTPHTPISPSVELPIPIPSPVEISPQVNVPTLPAPPFRLAGPMTPPVGGSPQANVPTLPAMQGVPDVREPGGTTGPQRIIDPQEQVPTFLSPMQVSGTSGTADVDTHRNVPDSSITSMPTLPQTQPTSGVQSPLSSGVSVQDKKESKVALLAGGLIGTLPATVKQAWSTSSSRRRLIFAALIAFVVLLVGSSILYAFTIPRGSRGSSSGGSSLSNTKPQTTVAPSSAVVTITPARTDFKKTYAISVVTGPPDASQRQVEGARLLSSTSPSQSQTVEATGQRSKPAVEATGQLTMTSHLTSQHTFPAGTTSKDVIHNIIAVYTQTFTLNPGQTVTFSAYISKPTGAKSNIAAGVMSSDYCFNNDPNCQHGYFHITNSAFTGGQNASSFTFVQQSDINGAVGGLESSLTQTARSALQAQLNNGEQLVGSPQCSPSVNSNHSAGDVAASVSVTVSATCTAEAYSQQAALSLAAGLLKSDAMSDPNASYTLVGSVVTSVVQVKGVDANGTVSLLVQASAPGVFQFSDAQKQKLAQLIVGKSEQDAQQLLLTQAGVSKVTITLPGGSGQTLPSTASQIMITVIGG